MLLILIILLVERVISAPPSAVKEYIESIRISISSPINDKLADFLADKENWDTFLNIKQSSPQAVDSFYKSFWGLERTSDLYYLKGKPTLSPTEWHPKLTELEEPRKYLLKKNPFDKKNPFRASEKLDINEFVGYISQVISLQSELKILFNQNVKSVTDHVEKIPDQSIFAKKLLEMFGRDVLRNLKEVEWKDKDDFLKKLKFAFIADHSSAASSHSNPEEWTFPKKVFVGSCFGFVALTCIILGYFLYMSKIKPAK